MSALLWWLIPIGATLLALAWAAFRSRPRRTVDTHESVNGMMRFTQAMRRPMPRPDEPGPSPRSSSARRTAPGRRPVQGGKAPGRSSAARPGSSSRGRSRSGRGHSTA